MYIIYISLSIYVRLNTYIQTRKCLKKLMKIQNLLFAFKHSIQFRMISSDDNWILFVDLTLIYSFICIYMHFLYIDTLLTLFWLSSVETVVEVEGVSSLEIRFLVTLRDFLAFIMSIILLIYSMVS